MSEDELYADSAYDELEDLLYDEGDPDIAGDLAEHTLYSPVYQDDPGWDMIDGYSDWDYYSDDYYDDDPSLLKDNPQDGTPPRPTNPTVKKGRKRKLDETGDIPALRLDERRTLEQCVRGTVWARPRLEPVMRYREGQAEKVSLLKDWKDLFRTKTKRGMTKVRRNKLRRDESWANDLSLEDMGLRHEKSMTANNVDLVNGPDTLNGAEEADEADEGYEDDDDSISSRGIATLEKSTEPDPKSRKRRKQEASTSLSPPPTVASSAAEGQGDGGKRRPLSPKPSSRSGEHENGLSHHQGPHLSHRPTDAIAAHTSKRKRDTSPIEVGVQHGSEDNVRTKEASRKRTVSSKLSIKAPQTPEKQPPLPTRRVTRSRKQ